MTDGAVGHQVIGHILPDENSSSSAAEVDALSASGARFVSRRLAESLAAVFGPQISRLACVHVVLRPVQSNKIGFRLHGQQGFCEAVFIHRAGIFVW